MLIEPVVLQELLARRVHGSFCLHDSSAWLEPRHNCRVGRAEQFALAEALSRGICGTRSSGSNPTTKL